MGAAGELSQTEVDSLQNAYRSLLDSRTDMIAGLNNIEQSKYRATVIVDAVIAGIMAHLTEVARNPETFADEMSQWGGGSPDIDRYARNWCSQVHTIFRDLGAAPRQNVEGRGRPTNHQ